MALIRVTDRAGAGSATVDASEVAEAIRPWFALEDATVRATVERLQEGITVGNQPAVDTFADMLGVDLEYLT